LLVGVSNQKPLQQGEKMHMSNVNHSKVILHESPLSWSPYDIKQLTNQIYSSAINNDYIDQSAPSNEVTHKTKCA
jgi:hypothetical protein